MDAKINFHLSYDDSNTHYDDEDTAFFDIKEAILEGDGEEDDSVTGTQLAFFDGLIPARENANYIYYSGKSILYPVSYVDYLWDFLPDAERKIAAKSLRLNNTYGLKTLYDQAIPIDTTSEYTFKFICRKKSDARAIFVINNRNFVCKQLKYTVRAEGIDPLVEGIFYPAD